MIAVPPAVLDDHRLTVLRSYQVLDSLPETGFDDLVNLAKQLCQTPVALISLVDADRQWFKAKVGVDLCQTPIEQAVCAHALVQPATLVVPDLTQDERTKDNALVTGEPGIRFYAGAVLRSPEGVPLGTLCVIDTTPRPGGLSTEQLSGLEALARQAMLLLELRRAVVRTEDVLKQQRDQVVATETRLARTAQFADLLTATARRLRLAQEAGQIGTFEIDLATNIVIPSAQFCRVYGLPFTPEIRASVIEALIVPEDAKLMSTQASRESGDAPLIAEYRIRRADTGDIVWISRRAEFVLDDAGQRIAMLGIAYDITARKKAEERSALLHAELGHRLKNTLAMVQALASQTLRGAGDREAVKAFDLRIAALGKAHDVLMQDEWAAADMRAVIERVLTLHGHLEQIEISGPPIRLKDRAVLSLSLLIHELATNAVKYGSLSAPEGHVTLSWVRRDCGISMTWEERGGPTPAPSGTGLGSRLINMGLAGTGDTDVRYEPSGLVARFDAPGELIESVGEPGR